MAEKLKPCPFCGGEAHSYDGTEYVRCDTCYALMPNIPAYPEFGYTVEEAIAAWNQRAVDGETSDGYHTFNELYHHRAVLFSKVVGFAGERAWKSKLHADGTMFDGYFIVGVETPEGQATYHYAIDRYWEMFDCKEVEHAPVWDGHTAQEAIARIERWNLCAERTCSLESVEGWTGGSSSAFICSACGRMSDAAEFDVRYCPQCGAKVVG